MIEDFKQFGKLYPGDRCVLTIDREITTEECTRIQDLWREFVQNVDIKMLIIPRPMKLQVIRGGKSD